MSFEKQLDEIASSYKEAIEASRNAESLDALRLKYLGRKSGEVTSLLKKLGGLSIEEKKKSGPIINRLKKEISESLQAKQKSLEEASQNTREIFDVTLPGRRPPCGGLHPITQVMDEVIDIFRSLGFSIESGPDIETDYYNFEALNIPKDHPARDMQDTFYLADDMVLRTHTSPVQIRVMEKKVPPLRIIVPGKVYRRDADVSHTPMFHQVEGLMVDEDISMSNLMAVLDQFVKAIFSNSIKTRFRPSFFSFTEPSAEVDISCVFCGGAGCRVCKGSGWLEILGAGMVDPEVFRHVNYDYEKYTGFAFGMGIERIAMLKLGIDDIRLFFDNDLRFLKQF